jgi:hypothetical protein
VSGGGEVAFWIFMMNIGMFCSLEDTLSRLEERTLDDGRCDDMTNLATCSATEFELAVSQHTLLCTTTFFLSPRVAHPNQHIDLPYYPSEAYPIRIAPF